MPGLGGDIFSGPVGGGNFGSGSQAVAASDARATYLARAQQFVTALTDPIVVFEDFPLANAPPSGWQQSLAGAAGIAGSALMASTALLSTSGTINSIARLSGPLAAQGTLNVQAANLSAWYFAGRFVTPNLTVNAAAVRAFGVCDTALSSSILVGIIGAGSTTRYQLQYNGNEAGSFFDLGLVADTNPHIVEVYTRNNGNLYVRVDLGPELSVGAFNANPSPMIPEMLVKNGANATNEQLRMDWYLAAAQRI